MCGMEGENLGDYITCGTCDVMSGIHTGGMVLDEEFQGHSFVQCLQGSINAACCLLQIKFVILWLHHTK